MLSARRIDAAHDRAPLPHLWLTGARRWGCTAGGLSEHGATPLDAWCEALRVISDGAGWWMWCGAVAVRGPSAAGAWALWCAAKGTG